ncbi:MAG: UDP-N-acetylglucosamine 2-epimerase [Acidimicrobiia bacterium]
MNQVHVFLGTRAQYIKMAPVMNRMDDAGIPYRFIDSGQHAALRDELRTTFDLKEPDYVLGGRRNIQSLWGGAIWTIRLLARMTSRRRILHQIFGGHGGICVVHGDTMSTLLATLMARRAGIPVAHVEAGLRSHSPLHPFPEELIRVAVMRRAAVLFAPDEVARQNLEQMRGLTGTIVLTSGNTAADALRTALGEQPPPEASGAVLFSIHRLENLYRPGRLKACVILAETIARERPVKFLLHEPTRKALHRQGLMDRLSRSGVEITRLLPHREFVRALQAAPFVVCDGGSIQEESAILGVPCLLWRAKTERMDGIDANAVLAHYDPLIVREFIRNPERYRRRPLDLQEDPSQEIVDYLVGLVD